MFRRGSSFDAGSSFELDSSSATKTTRFYDSASQPASPDDHTRVGEFGSRSQNC